MKKIKNILAVIDDSKENRDILKKAISCAKIFNAEKIIILYTIHIPFFDLPFYKKDVPIDKDRVKKSIDKIFNELNSDNISHYTVVYFGDKTDRAIVEAKKDDVDIIVTGDHIEYEKVIRESQKSLLVVKNSYREYRDILIPTDLSLKSKESIEFTKRYFSKSKLSLVHGYENIAVAMSMYDIGYMDMVDYQEENREIAKRLLEDFSKEVKIDGELTDTSFSLPYGILAYIKDKKPDLVVVASHSKESSFFIGSTSSYLAKESPCDIFIYN